MNSIRHSAIDNWQCSVLHVDVDAFFASVEQLLIPRLRGRPVAVGNGVIASCSYEARRFGLHAGMPLYEARRQCPAVVILDGQQAIYKCFAEQIWDICRRYTDGLETFLDEAYGDVTGMGRLYGQPLELGRSLRQAVLEEVGLSVSVGLAANRMLAKMASKSAKPGGVACVPPEQAEAFLENRPARDLLGVGSKTEKLLAGLNISTIGQMRRLPREALRAMLGERGEVLYERCRGGDVTAIRPDERRRPRTISRETTFHSPQCDVQAIRGMLFYLLERAMRAMRAQSLRTHTVELTLRYDDWKQVAARGALEHPTQIDGEAYEAVCRLLERLHTRRVALRHVGVVLSNFSAADDQPQLFTEPTDRQRKLHDAVDRIRDRWGHAAVVTGESAELLGKLEQNDYGFVLRTPSLTK